MRAWVTDTSNPWVQQSAPSLRQPVTDSATESATESATGATPGRGVGRGTGSGLEYTSRPVSISSFRSPEARPPPANGLLCY
jgi:hypothetical protein